jgi:hypothetical protein
MKNTQKLKTALIILSNDRYIPNTGDYLALKLPTDSILIRDRLVETCIQIIITEFENLNAAINKLNEPLNPKPTIVNPEPVTPKPEEPANAPVPLQ